MRTKEEYYEDTLKNRALLESQEVLDCSCPYSRCEWHGKCRECVARCIVITLSICPVACSRC